MISKRPQNSHRVIMSVLLGVATVAIFTTASCAVIRGEGGGQPASSYSADSANRWFDLAYTLTRSESISPPVASRAFAYMGVALYESVLPGMPQHRSLADQVNGELEVPEADEGATYSWPLVANAALASITPLFYKSEKSYVAIGSLQSEIRGELAKDISSEVVFQSEERGRTVGSAIARWALGDGYDSLKGCAYTPATFDGAWSLTPPAYADAIEPCWGRLRPFALDSIAAFRPPPPPAFSESVTSEIYLQAKEVYDTAKNRTPQQRATAAYWADGPGTTGTPAGHSISIVSQLVRERNNTLEFAAEAYARVGIAVADGFISCWEAKYAYNYLRPVTYIQLMIDPEWLSMLNTPPFPEYPSGHSVQSSAAAEVLAALFGPGPFVDRTHEARGLGSRSYESFADAAKEASISRLYGGIHFRPALDIGLEQGKSIGQAVNELLWTK